MSACYYCGSELDTGAIFCKICHRDQRKYIEICKKSDELYNKALEKAYVKDLSGAVLLLKSSLKYNKKNIDARNLLGLIFYERGNLSEAIQEWVISKNFEPSDNRADYYLKSIKKSTEIEKYDKDAERFNRALNFCKKGDTDLAKVQLRRVVSGNPKNMDAISLLVLIYIVEKNFSGALKYIKIAQQVDVSYTDILKYKREVDNYLKDKKKRKKRKAELINFSDGNDNVIMSKATFHDFTYGSRVAFFNILTGIFIGILFTYFLIIPTIKQNEKHKVAASMVDLSEAATNSESSVTELKNKVKSLKQELGKYNTKSDTVTSYEKLLSVKDMVDKGGVADAPGTFSEINRELLSDNGKVLYDSLSAVINNEALKKNMSDARGFYRKKDYDSAINAYLTVTKLQETYEDGKALFELAESYEKNSDIENAKKYYSRIIEVFKDDKDSKIVKKAQGKLNKLSAQ